MNDELTKPRTRREFLRGIGRGMALSAVACAAAALAARRNSGGARLKGQTCVNNGVCRGCAAFSDCCLPQALSAKRAGMKQ